MRAAPPEPAQHQFGKNTEQAPEDTNHGKEAAVPEKACAQNGDGPITSTATPSDAKEEADHLASPTWRRTPLPQRQEEEKDQIRRSTTSANRPRRPRLA
jgi:hypothetical protein